MIRRSVLWVGLLTFAAALLLHTSLLTRQQEDKLNEITRQITAEQERIRVLTAEWHSLKTPERLEKLAARHLNTYAPIAPKQLASLLDIPDKLPAAAAVAAATPTVAPASAPAPVRVAATKPAPVVEKAEAAKPDVMAALIDRESESPIVTAAATDSDDLRMLIERQPTAEGFTAASYLQAAR